MVENVRLVTFWGRLQRDFIIDMEAHKRQSLDRRYAAAVRFLQASIDTDSVVRFTVDRPDDTLGTFVGYHDDMPEYIATIMAEHRDEDFSR